MYLNSSDIIAIITSLTTLILGIVTLYTQFKIRKLEVYSKHRVDLIIDVLTLLERSDSTIELFYETNCLTKITVIASTLSSRTTKKLFEISSKIADVETQEEFNSVRLELVDFLFAILRRCLH